MLWVEESKSHSKESIARIRSVLEAEILFVLIWKIHSLKAVEVTRLEDLLLCFNGHCYSVTSPLPVSW